MFTRTEFRAPQLPPFWWAPSALKQQMPGPVTPLAQPLPGSLFEQQYLLQLHPAHTVYVSPAVTLITISLYEPVTPNGAPPQQQAGLVPLPAPHAWNFAVVAPAGTVHVQVAGPYPYFQLPSQTFR